MSYQNSNGFLNQLLDDPSTFEETSSTAMMSLALSRGINMGWLDNSYKDKAISSWNSLTKQIGEDGTVYGICQGTGMSTDAEFYKTRKTPDHDPRGVGAVITAGLEMLKLLSDLKMENLR